MPASETVIADHPPSDGREWDCQCARCGSSCDWTECPDCAGEGYSHHDCMDDCCACLHPENNVPCSACYGFGGWYSCLSSSEFCLANPLPGREATRRESIEWFVVEGDPD